MQIAASSFRIHAVATRQTVKPRPHETLRASLREIPITGNGPLNTVDRTGCMEGSSGGADAPPRRTGAGLTVPAAGCSARGGGSTAPPDEPAGPAVEESFSALRPERTPVRPGAVPRALAGMLCLPPRVTASDCMSPALASFGTPGAPRVARLLSPPAPASRKYSRPFTPAATPSVPRP
jgi:hypothetical protein